MVISMGRYCSVGEGAVIRPPGKIYKGCVDLLTPPPLFSSSRWNSAFTFYPIRIADFVTIGPGCIIEAAQIGHGVNIEEGSIVVRLSIQPCRRSRELMEGKRASL